MLLAVPQVVKLLNNAVERRVDADGRRAIFERLHAIARQLPMALVGSSSARCCRASAARFSTSPSAERR